jgi:hypothetical protein
MDLFEKISICIMDNDLFSKLVLGLTILSRHGIITTCEQYIIENFFKNLYNNVSTDLFKETLLIAHKKQFKILKVSNFNLRNELLHIYLEPKTLFDLCVLNIYINYDLDKLSLPKLLTLNENL